MSQARIRPLTWDSAFFGLRIGRLEPDADETTDLERLARLDRSAFDCIYVELDIGAAHLVDRWVALGARPIDTRAELVAPLADAPRQARDPDVERSSIWSDADRSDAMALAEDLSRWSRFAMDPRFSGKAPALYRRWVELAISGEHDAFVVRVDDRLAGLLTSRLAEDTAWIELLVVADAHRSAGIGTLLIGEFLADARQRAKAAARVRTQLRNGAAVRAYERSGFALARTTFVLHWWSE